MEATQRLAKVMEALMKDDRFVQATLQTAKVTEETKMEAEYGVMGGGSSNHHIAGPQTVGEHCGHASILDDYSDKGEDLIYHGHTHPNPESMPEPSICDLDLANLHSTKNTPIFAVCANGENYVNGVAFRRKKPITKTGYCLTASRQATNAFLKGILGLETNGFTSIAYRRFRNQCEKGFREAAAGIKDIYDVVPDALAETGIYEANGFGIRKDYGKEM